MFCILLKLLITKTIRSFFCNNRVVCLADSQVHTEKLTVLCTVSCMKSVQIRSFSGSYFSVSRLNTRRNGPEKTLYLDSFRAVVYYISHFLVEFHRFNAFHHKMARPTLKILQHLLQDFKSVSDHFRRLWIKGLWQSIAQKMRVFVKGFFSKCDQIRWSLQIWSHLLKESLMKNFIFLRNDQSSYQLHLIIEALLF